MCTARQKDLLWMALYYITVSTASSERHFIVFRDKHKCEYVYETHSSMNGRFMASIDLTEMQPGEYKMAIAGALAVSNDALGKSSKGYFCTEYKLTVM